MAQELANQDGSFVEGVVGRVHDGFEQGDAEKRNIRVWIECRRCSVNLHDMFQGGIFHCSIKGGVESSFIKVGLMSLGGCWEVGLGEGWDGMMMLGSCEIKRAVVLVFRHDVMIVMNSELVLVWLLLLLLLLKLDWPSHVLLRHGMVLEGGRGRRKVQILKVGGP